MVARNAIAQKRGIALKASPISEYEVPGRYYKDLLHLMVVGTNSLYVYWEISDRRRWLVSQHFECDFGAMPCVIRLYDVTHVLFNGHNAHTSWDTTIPPETTHAYLHQAGANRNYIVDVGTYTWEHEFIPLLRSNCVATPKDSEENWGEPR
ncbi:DUF4912 domain-containing protein [Paenibacillus sp. PFR10]|uniref:DUF4912 domain-containing protein n=1 Tax=Paenibacillus violae TaxID=3077234 RepID=A0ABU3RII8_9BACL|nr:DUF4912 domain-containing protein [Paenibacillus sp. PFR10]